MPKMNPEVKSKLCHRLRTTTVPQGFRSLNCNGAMCALGHACELAVEAGVIERQDKESGYVGYGPVASKYLPAEGATHYCDVYPPEQVIAWLGINDRIVMDLVTENDVNHKTLPEIADLIEEHY